MKLSFVVALLCSARGVAFVTPLVTKTSSSSSSQKYLSSEGGSNDAWQGEIVPGGQVRGCSIQGVGEDPITEWTLTIDGIQADLGRFSAAIYKKIISDAKQQRFQGFRPGTIPPHLEPTYRAFTMDECARETILEAMEQNNIRPFSTARTEFVIGQVSIPPPSKKPTTKKAKSKQSKKKIQEKEGEASSNERIEEEEAKLDEESKWLTFDDMKGAIDAGWKPGQSFSFVATNVKGQRVLSRQATEGAKPLGLNY